MRPDLVYAVLVCRQNAHTELQEEGLCVRVAVCVLLARVRVGEKRVREFHERVCA